MREKFKQNTLDQYNKYDPKTLYAMLQSNPQQLATAERLMGLGAGGLKKLSEMPPSERERLDLENQRLQNQKLRQDIYGGGAGGGAPTIKSINGRDMQWDSKTQSWVEPIAGGAGGAGGTEELLMERGADKVKQIEGLIMNDKGIRASAGLIKGSGLVGLQNMRNWQADVKNVLSKLTVDELARVKGEGVTFGALSDPERKAIGDAASALNAGMIMKDDGVTPTGRFSISENMVRDQLKTIQKYAEIDFKKRTGMSYADYKSGKYILPAERDELKSIYNNNTAINPGGFNPGSYY